jgi:hypothetical protein
VSNTRVIKLDIDDGRFELAKRTYLPYMIKATCPTCGGVARVDLSDDYLSYPEAGTPIQVSLRCFDAEGEETCETFVDIVIGIQVARGPYTSEADEGEDAEG